MKKTVFYYQDKESPIPVDGKKTFKYLLFMKSLGFHEVSFFIDTNFSHAKNSFREEIEFCFENNIKVSLTVFVRPYLGDKMLEFVRLVSDLELLHSKQVHRWIFNIEGVCLDLDVVAKNKLVKCFEGLLDIPDIQVDFCLPAYPSKKFDKLLQELCGDYRDYCKMIPMLYTDRKNLVASMLKMRQPLALSRWIEHCEKTENIFYDNIARGDLHIAHMLNGDMSYPFPLSLSAEENVETFYQDLRNSPDRVDEILVWRSKFFKESKVKALWTAYNHLLDEEVL